MLYFCIYAEIIHRSIFHRWSEAQKLIPRMTTKFYSHYDWFTVCAITVECNHAAAGENMEAVKIACCVLLLVKISSVRGNHLSRATATQFLLQAMGQLSDTFLKGFLFMLSVYMKDGSILCRVTRKCIIQLMFHVVLIFCGYKFITD